MKLKTKVFLTRLALVLTSLLLMIAFSYQNLESINAFFNGSYYEMGSSLFPDQLRTHYDINVAVSFALYLSLTAIICWSIVSSRLHFAKVWFPEECLKYAKSKLNGEGGY